MLRIYDADIDDYCLDPDYKQERREVVICRTFNELPRRSQHAIMEPFHYSPTPSVL